MSAKCDACGKTAYPVESVKIQDLVFHKKCFKCLHHSPFFSQHIF